MVPLRSEQLLCPKFTPSLIDTPKLLATTLGYQSELLPCLCYERNRLKGWNADQPGYYGYFKPIGTGLKFRRLFGRKRNPPLPIPNTLGIAYLYQLAAGIEEQKLHEVDILSGIGLTIDRNINLEPGISPDTDLSRA